MVVSDSGVTPDDIALLCFCINPKSLNKFIAGILILDNSFPINNFLYPSNKSSFISTVLSE